ncbi:phosphodiester glycosidase family protein [Streptomyces sp. B-S-A6]|uniref:Phosphodiester glycosidase family protein n=1 Tax=Streptomyces cavernicola TaxID=3043613 RepID=A0ABT6SE52_9ACTN|nr:phosphodiester glycosidase family protein [Streptomyces sp. B-S-A6]MDI3406244.1 phosphodiester glycosidase family protein [Streptomyces sp. B-S-A6]
MRFGQIRRRRAATTALACAALVGATLAGAAPARAEPYGPGDAPAVQVAPGVEYRSFTVEASHGPAQAHLVTVDLRDPRTSLDLLHPGAVAARGTISSMANSADAVAAVNGDFFNISETQHPGVEATGASVGPAVADGRQLKAAVPDGQRFGPALPPGTHTPHVFGVGLDRRARLDRLDLHGSVTTEHERLPLGGLNQYALPVGSVGAFTSDWGAVSRLRSVCGTDTDRAAPCSTDTHEVTVRAGRVVATADTPGAGPVGPHETVLVGRESGAQQLRKLAVGDPVDVRHRLVAEDSLVPFRFAVGGYPVLRDGQPLEGLDPLTSAVRSAVGSSDGGQRLHLLALDGSLEYRTGLTIAEVAALMRELGARDAFSLDGGGSSTLASREPGAPTVTVRNHPSGGVERPVPNGIGVFVRG